MPYKSNEHELKHLDILQALITRMAANSFLIKGWTITLASALFAMSAKDADRSYAFLAVFPALTFCCLDAYYLSLERMFRNQYESATAQSGMTIAGKPVTATWLASLASLATWPIYLFTVFIAVLIGLRYSKFGA
jgi:hypothetical protein